MAVFEGFILTKKGEELLRKALLGEKITFTNIKIGSGEAADIYNLESLVEEKATYPINQIKLEKESVLLKTIFNNKENSEGYYIKEVGIFAKGEDNTEILYSYNKAKIPDLFPIYDNKNLFEYEYLLYTIIKQAENITAIIDESTTYLTKDEAKDIYVAKTQKATAEEEGITSFKRIADYLYPIGAIYTSVDESFDPNAIFTGVWERYAEGQTLVGVNTKDTDFNSVEKTGGSKTTTLTTEQIPAHSHGINAAGNHAHGIHAVGDHAHTVGDHAHYMPAHQHVIPWGENPGVYQPDWGIWHAGGGGRMGNDKYTWDNAWGMTSWADGWTGGSTPGTYGAGNHAHGMDAAGNHSHIANNTGGGKGHSNLQPYITVYFWKRIS